MGRGVGYFGTGVLFLWAIVLSSTLLGQLKSPDVNRADVAISGSLVLLYGAALYFAGPWASLQRGSRADGPTGTSTRDDLAMSATREAARSDAQAEPDLRRSLFGCMLAVMAVPLVITAWYLEWIAPPTVICSLPDLSHCPTLDYREIRWTNPDNFARPASLEFAEPPRELGGNQREWDAFGTTHMDPDFVAVCRSVEGDGSIECTQMD
jgi:hypothetical protein